MPQGYYLSPADQFDFRTMRRRVLGESRTDVNPTWEREDSRKIPPVRVGRIVADITAATYKADGTLDTEGVGEANTYLLEGDGTGTRRVDEKKIKVLNIFPTPLLAGTLCFFFRDQTLKHPDREDMPKEGYIAQPLSEPNAPPPATATPCCILTQLSSTPITHSLGDPAKDFIFSNFRTNDTIGFAPVFDNVENPGGGNFNGVKIKRAGAYIARYGFSVRQPGFASMSGTDEPELAGGETVGGYLLRNFERSSWNMKIQLYRDGLLTPFLSTEPALNCSAFYFCNQSFQFSYGDTDDFMLQADRIMRIHLDEFTGFAVGATPGIVIDRAFLEVWRFDAANNPNDPPI